MFEKYLLIHNFLVNTKKWPFNLRTQTCMFQKSQAIYRNKYTIEEIDQTLFRDRSVSIYYLR